VARYNRAMRVRILFFGQLREIAGGAEHDAELPPGALMEDAFAHLTARWAALAAFRAIVIAARNQEFAPWNTALADGDEIAFLPPVSGGAPPANANEACELVGEPIPVAGWVAWTKTAEDGAIAVFEGIVRDHSHGRRTLYLEYEAYAPMALAKMHKIAAQAREKFAIHRIVIVHRLGRMEIGEASVLVAVSSAHRADSFDACRFAIDTLKQVVPIWKKEYFLDGFAWADGENPAVSAATQPVRLGKPSNEAR
jgi:molybdopterin converting factor subunit 1